MKMTITVETERTIILSRRAARHRCERCGEEQKMLSLEDASAIAGEIVFQKIKSGELHAFENETGSTLVCVASLIQNKPKLINKEQENENK